MFPHKNCPMFLSCRSLFFFSSSLLCGLELIYYRAETWQRSRHNNLKNVHTKIQWWVSWFILSQSLPENSVLRNGAQLMHKWACNPVYFIFLGKKKKASDISVATDTVLTMNKSQNHHLRKQCFCIAAFSRESHFTRTLTFLPFITFFFFFFLPSENLDFQGLWHPYNG